MKNTVNIFLDYKEDARKSMEIYSSALFKYSLSNDFSFSIFRPKKTYLNRLIPNFLGLPTRVSRYIEYPFQAFFRRGCFNHVIDHTYAHLIGALGCDRSVVTVHDLIPLLAWRGKLSDIKLDHRPLLFEYSCSFLERAARIIAASESTKQDLINLLNIHEQKIDVVHLGVDPRFQPTYYSEKFNFLPFVDKNVFNVLIIGNAIYKNNRTAFSVVQRLESYYGLEIQLICLGNDPKKFKNDQNGFTFSRKPLFVQDLDLNSMVQLYNSCHCLLFPSIYEGFGMPLLEAMACGTPVVSADTSSLPEIVGQGALTAKPLDVDALSLCMMQALTDSSIRNRMISIGLERAKSFTWEKTLEGTLRVYRRAWEI
jgi:glycosyltransferase involved in cell wall biosynthesis